MDTEAFELGYETADTMINNGAYPTTRDLTAFDIHLYAEVAASAKGVQARKQFGPSGSNHDRRLWMDEFEKGYQSRLDQYQTFGMVIAQMWHRGQQFGVANAPERLYEVFEKMGGHKEPAHYGFSWDKEIFIKNSYLFPPEMWTSVVTFLKTEHEKEQGESNK
jgi:hypothetical protein